MRILFGSLLIGIICGGFIGYIWSTLLNGKFLKILCVLIIVSWFSLIAYGGMSSEIKYFNSGYCVRCGIKYQAITHKNGQTYYECPNCHYGVWY